VVSVCTLIVEKHLLFCAINKKISIKKKYVILVKKSL